MTVIRVDKIRKLVFPNKICQPVLRVDLNFQPLFNEYMRIGALVFKVPDTLVWRYVVNFGDIRKGDVDGYF